ncbi:lactosylceramide 1,3-N-acetyl-beta-D-glucosaminyltransferase-like [Scleropages formosus]|uniref:Hexosyltransferase n=1 Tax=Scleropages formosus TaxID=113540 RepID=A0A0P7U4Y3_SCLFO|nr:lactosylceramide 1,3-N-acetyl-beta-D-glucosaminyltransferase A-like [Scleropages formosus]KPP62291.1 lactosylceramide 1,3-N-acetyl-beta-D-glucosaminyltransferase-like [Scleropages formosus]
MNLRRIRKRQLMHLMTTCFILSVVMVYWEQLDNNIVSYMKSFSYRYLFNSYNFLNTSFTVSREEAERFGSRHYLINHKRKCTDVDVLLLLLVKSSPENVERRAGIRSTWGNETYAFHELGVHIRVLFMLGESGHSQVEQDLMQEDWCHGDLIQQDFLDTFHNLTVKLLMQFRWAHAYCAHARFFMSVDDDVFVHIPNLVHYLQEMASKNVQDFWIGHVHKGSPPIRRKDSKYYVPYEMYQWSSYPDYTAGAGYVVSRNVVAKIYQASLTLNATLYIDDVFMGICANVMGVSPQEHIYFTGGEKVPYHICVYDKMMTSHGHVKDMHYLWKEATSPQVKQTTSWFLGRLYCTMVKIKLFCMPNPFTTYPCKAAFL